ncbi:helix-turn-helix transcriptional regulator [Vibrio sp. S4M6]|uniref:helix-turn-helix domain-containing protein n=1 Tax=Vibrio sinus TaxID=2946865 RepID=UPI00202A1259|nr:helix-turn-helix transcriptional regulator [Vibrio sinus]MCL9783066.1 helix-turn-helix transcriptional regulator [Vibrio sinus]
MKTTSAQRIENIKNNLSYAIKSRNETKKSFSEISGINRTTIYQILDGKVNRIQHQTVEKIANFFGTTCYVIEEGCVESLEIKNNQTSKEGNKNPIAVPIIDEHNFTSHWEKYIGELIVQFPLTYYLYDECNLIALRVNKVLKKYFSGNTLLIINRLKHNNEDQIVIINENNELDVKTSHYKLKSNERLIGSIREERFDG